MTTRYGPLYASFWEWDDPDYDPITTTPTPLTILEIESAEVVKKLGQMTRGRFTAPKQDNWEFFLQEGRLVSLYQFDGVLNANREMGGFLMEKVRPALRADGKMMIEVSGLGREKLLTRYRHWAPVGDETTYVTTIGTTVPAPWATTVDVGAPAGNDHIIVDDLGGAQVGDIIRIEMENSDIFITKIVDIEPPGAPAETAVLEARLPYSSFAGRPVEFRRGRMTVASVAGMGAGLEIQILLDSMAIHQTVIADVDIDAVQVLLRDGIPSAATAGNQVTTYDYSAPATDDVTQIMAPAVAAGWELAFGGAYTGTENGTAHQPEGDSVWDLLVATAEQSGEFFRIAELESGETPRKKIRWFRTNDASTMTLILYESNVDVNTATENINLGVVHEIQREREHNVITRVYPLGADGRVSLAYATDAALAEASSAGFTVGTDSGLYGKDYVQYTAGVTAHGVLSDVVRYGNLTLSDKGAVSELQAAADSMLRQAMATILESQEREYWHVKAHTHRPLYPGQAVALSNTVTDPTQATATFYVLEVRESFEKGVVMSHLVLSKEPQQRPTATVMLGRQLKSTLQAALRPSGSGVTMVGAVVGGGGGGGGTTDHGALTGLGDDDHPQYWNNTRGDAKIATHAAIANAHHNPVTVGNTGLSLSTQQVSLALKASNPGLEISSGLGMGTPSTLTAATTNTVSGSNHAHAITATDNAKTTASTLLKGTANGDLTLRHLNADKAITPEIETASGDITIDPASGKTINDGNLEFTGARSLTTSSGSLTLAPTAGLILDPTDDAITVAASASLKTADWASGFLGTGWGVTYAGAADFRSIYADELHVAAFIADTARVKVGAEYITPSMAIISRTFTIPAVSSTGTLYVEDAPGLDDTPVFADNDWLLLRIIDRPAGGLNVLNVWGQVSGYSNLSDGEQSWTFTTRSAAAAAVGEAARRGGIALDFGKSGDGWITLTTLDTAGSPYLGITQWQGSDPYTSGNRSHKLRLGQLQGVSGAHEWGLQAGQSTSNFIRFSDIRSEIHGTRFSLYAGDGGQLRVTAARVIHYRAAGSSSNLAPNADHTVQGVLSTGATYYTEVDENPGSPTTSDYIYNDTNQSGIVFLGLGNPTWTGITYQVNLQCHIVVTGLMNDAINLYGQVFASDEMTPLTSEKLIYAATTNTAGTTPNVQCDQVFTSATQSQWNGARLRLRWEYAINASEEAIRLDPNVPSIAVGNPLPTGYQAGGAGFWAGWHGTAYGVRMGHPTGPNARWDGANFRIANDAGADVFYFPSSGEAYIASPVHLGTAGGIWQGTGSGASFAAPKSGWKLYNDGTDKGAFSAYNASGQKLVQVDHDGFHGYIATSGTVAVHVRGTGVEFDNATAANSQTGLNWVTSSTTYSSIYGWKDGSAANLWAAVDSKASGHPAVIQLDAQNSVDTKNAYVTIRAGDTDADTYVLITPGARIAKGLVVGTTATVVNQGQIVADLAGVHDFNQLILQDTTDVAHNMTSLVATGTYGVLGKVAAGDGGLDVDGFSDDTVGLRLAGHGVNQSTTNATTSAGSITMDAAIRSGAGPSVTALGATGNVLAVRNNGTALMLIKGNGDVHLNTTLTQNSFDTYDDVALLRAADLTLAGQDIDRQYGEWLKYNRADLEAAGLVAGDFVNTTRLQRLITGAVFQLHERIARLEGLSG